MRRFSIISSLLFGACASIGGDESTVHDDVITPATPYRKDLPGQFMPDLGTGGFAMAPISDTALDGSQMHEGTFGTGRTTGRAGATDPGSWDAMARGGDFADFESSPYLASDLDDALAAASPTLGKLTDLSGLAAALREFPLPIVVDDPTTPDYFYGWQPNQARWLRSQYIVTSATGAMTKEVYADPMFGGEIRERGARLYCAARNANMHQSDATVSMGRQVALRLGVFGHEIDLGVVETTFALDGPQKITRGGASDGAQAFEIPMLVGTAITPIDGLGLPGFGEVRAPVVLTTGDSEVASAFAPQTLHVGDHAICTTGGKRPVCQTFPVYAVDSVKDYLTVTHADAYRGRSAGLTVHVPNIPLFTMGAFTVYMNGGGSLSIGTATTPQDRLLAGVPSGWPATRDGDVTASPWAGWVYDVGPWALLAPIEDPTTGLTTANPTTFSLPKSGGLARFEGSDPLLMRALADDDHHVSTSTDASLTVGVEGDFGFSLGIADFKLVGTGSITVAAGNSTDIRDGMIDLMGNGNGIPTTALTATPSSHAGVDVGFDVYLNIHIPLLFDSIDETVHIVHADTEKHWAPSAWDQTSRALIATGTSYGDPTNQPAIAYSHLPAPGGWPVYFDSFDESVPACIADTRSYPTTPEPCQPGASGSTPAGNLCVFSGSWLVNVPIGYGTTDSWRGACSDIPDAVDSILGATASDAEKTCMKDTIAYLCTTQSLEQDWHGQHGISHVLPVAVNGGSFDFGALAKECAAAFPGPATDTFNRIFEFGACDASAKMLDPDEAVAPLDPTSSDPPPVSPAGSCH